MMPVITPLYAALLGLMYFALSARTIYVRRQLKVSLGHGEQRALEKAVRVHANFAEYVPLTLLLLWMLEWQGAAAWWLYSLNTALLLGRGLHAYGMGHSPQILPLRITGMMLTFSALLGAALSLLFWHFSF